MRASTVSAITMLVLALKKEAHAFAPPRPASLRTRAPPDVRSMTSHRMVMDRNDPLHMMEEELFPQKQVKKSTDPKPFFVDLVQSSVKQNMKFVAAALAMALVLSPLPSDAAMSGGRMGGSYSRPMQTRSMPSRGGSSYSRGYSSGYSAGGYYSRPSIAITPGIGFGYSPFVSPFSPFGGYYGGGFGGGAVISRGPSFFDLIFFGGIFLAATNFIQQVARPSMGSTFEGFGSSTSTALGPGTSVIQVSVAMEVPNRDDPSSILSVLNRLSQTAKTDSRVGIQNLTSQVALELLRRRSSIVSASSSYKHFRDNNMAQRDYENLAIKERSKFEKETVSKFGGVDYSIDGNASPTSGVDGKATMAVITLVLAIDGDSTKVPSINSVSDVEEALRRISSDSKVDDCLQSVEILWTPEDRTESLSLRDVVADYPELRSV